MEQDSTKGIGRSEGHCQDWNTLEFFTHATLQEVRDCLDAGADTNAADDGGRTPLDLAVACNNNPEVAEATRGAGERGGRGCRAKWSSTASKP